MHLCNLFHDFLLYKAGLTVKSTLFCIPILSDINLAVAYVLRKCLLHMLSEKVTGVVIFQSALICTIYVLIYAFLVQTFSFKV